MKKTTMKISYDNFWAIEKFRVENKLPSKDEAIRKLIEEVRKKNEKNTM